MPSAQQRGPAASDPGRAGGPLAGRVAGVAGRGLASEYAASLLRTLGAEVERAAGKSDPHPDLDWARSGAMALTGPAAGAPRIPRAPVAACARGAARALASVAGNPLAGLDGPGLLGERGALAGLVRGGTTSPGGSCRLLPAADRWIAVNLARPDDLELLPAWLGEGDRSDPWAFAAERIAGMPASEAVARARLLGLPAAVARSPGRERVPWFRIAARGPALPRHRAELPLVIDLSSLWAGPLCTHLLGLAGARVIKVESARRPDGARAGPRDFFDLLNADKSSVALDFGSAAGRRALRGLCLRADVVVETARPRALAQLGIDAESLVATRPGLTWVALSGYGRREPQAGWVAFGDDAAVAAGLAVATGRRGGPPLFCGDAIADPIAGLHAALAALASWSAGGGHLLDLSLCDVLRHVLGFARSSDAPEALRADGRDGPRWEVTAAGTRAVVAAPRARPARSAARPLGADTAAVLRELAVAC